MTGMEFAYCAYCGHPVVRCTMTECLYTGWVHLKSRKHHCDKRRWLRGATGRITVRTYAWPLAPRRVAA